MMKNQRALPVTRLLEVLLVTVLVVCALAAGFDFYYDLNDDTTIKAILSGAYTGTPSGYSVQMLYPLGALIALCYRAIPGGAWYGLFLCLCQFGVFALIGFRLTGIFHTKKSRFLALLLEALLFTGLLFRELIMVQYSVTSGICMAGAIFLYTTGETKDTTASTIKANIMPMVLVVLSFMIRTEMCLMLLTFLFLAGISRLLLEPAKGKVKKTDIVRRNLIIALFTLLGMAAVYGLDLLATFLSPVGTNWQRFDDFFNARTKLYDFYELPDYQENYDFYQQIGLSRESYALLQNYNFALDDSIDEHLLEEINAYIEEGDNVSEYFHLLYTKNSLKQGIWLYKQRLITLQDGVWGVLLLYLYVTLILFILRLEEKRRLLQLGKVAALFVMRSFLWLYILMVDRVLDRITVPLLLAESILLISWILGVLWTFQIRETYFYTILLVCGICALCYNGKKTWREYTDREEINPRWEAFMTYSNYFPDDFFVMDVYSSTSYDGIPYAEKIFKNVDNSLKNYDICGGWLVKSPLYKEKLQKFNITDVENALKKNTTGKSQVYFVAACDKDLNWLNAYYEHKGQKIQIVCADKIWYRNEAIFNVYSIETVEG